MALVRVRLIGTGTRQDPWRAPLPTSVEVLTLPDEGLVYVLIPDEDSPNLHSHKSAKHQTTGHGAALIGLDADGHSAWHKHLDGRYQEHKGKFRPEIA